MDNCSIIDHLSKENNQAFNLMASNLTLINTTTFFDSILDDESEIGVYWYLNLLTVNKDKNIMKSVDIKIYDANETEIFTSKTNENGELNWIPIKEKSIYKYITIKNNPHKITAKKSGKDKYSGSEWISINKNNTAENQTIQLNKKKKESEADLQDTLYIFCICFMVIITVFIILMTVNIYLARKKAGLYGLNQYNSVDKKPSQVSTKSIGNLSGEVITCSECGTEINEDSKFCPHCGEYFEGDEFACSGCGSKLAGDASSCPKCGKIFEQDQSSRVKDKEKKGTSEPKLFCSECGAVVVIKDQKCPGCGAIFSGPSLANLKDKKDQKIAQKITEKEEKKIKKQKEIKEIIGDESYMCSICGADVSEKSSKCPKCGTELE
jgi:predicted amidophosphoribosyltransferase